MNKWNEPGVSISGFFFFGFLLEVVPYTKNARGRIGKIKRGG